MSQQLEQALELALRAHRGQTDKGGEPYILHPLRLMCRLRRPDEQVVALLHDVVEDSDISLRDLEEAGFTPEVIAAVDCLTRRREESYDAFIERVAPNALARRVKLAISKTTWTCVGSPTRRCNSNQ